MTSYESLPLLNLIKISDYLHLVSQHTLQQLMLLLPLLLLELLLLLLVFELLLLLLLGNHKIKAYIYQFSNQLIKRKIICFSEKC